MSDTRALRAQLEEAQAELHRTKEHLGKLRAHQAREQEALRQQLSQAQQEVSGLRGRLEALALSGGMPAPRLAEALSEAVVAERAATALVALAQSPKEGFTPDVLSSLCKLLNVAPADVRLRLSTMFPAVLARLPLAEAEELRASLKEEGFLAMLHEVSPSGPRNWVGVKRFSLEEGGLRVLSHRRENFQVSYRDLRLVMRGRKTTTHVETKREVEYQVHHSHQHRVSREVEEKRQQVENFLWVLGRNFRAIFNESTQYMGLGALRAFTVHENLQRLMDEFQRHAPHVVLDTRFLQQARFVMPFVEPGRGREMLAEVLFQAVDEGLWT